jgi:hypothetical protein
MKKKQWKKLSPVGSENTWQACMSGPPTTEKASMHMRIAVGFGDAYVKKDTTVVWDEVRDFVRKDKDVLEHWREIPTLMRFEYLARKDPDHDWRCVLNAPLRYREYQRQGRNLWILIKSNQTQTQDLRKP